VTALAAGLLLSAVWLAVWSYVLYPPWIRILSARRVRLPAPVPATPPVSVDVLVAASDEESVISERVRDLLAQRWPGPLSVSLGCDGCADQTAQRARDAARGDPRLRITEFPSRRGKASVLNDLAASSSADVLVFTDANTRFDPGAIDRLGSEFADPSVGAACGRLILEGREASPEAVFWERETSLKESEGRLGVCLGANGAIYAARRASVERLPADTTMDDFLIAARIAGRGEAVVFVGDAVARERLPEGPREEVARRFRIGIGAGQVLRRERWLWNPRRPLLAFVFLSRKAARWVAPVATLLAAAAAAASPTLRPLGLTALALSAALMFSARRNLRLRGLPGTLYYFAVINLALAGGVVAGFLGYRRPAWKPTGR